MNKLDWRAAAWLAAGAAVVAVALAAAYSNARSTEAQERTIQVCMQRGGQPEFDSYNRFEGCK